jgi:uncharacterized integral membrane protein (TIGR00698 family)
MSIVQPSQQYNNGRKVLFILLAVLTAIPFSIISSNLPEVSPPIALLLGIALATTLGNPYKKESGKFSKILLQVAVVGLGFKMNVHEAAEAGKTGLVFTIASISLTLLAGIWIGKKMGIDKTIAYLISAGTAICGGSAIAAVGPVVKAKEHEMSVALGTVFILNAIALLIFPYIGHFLHLSEQQFGLWAAIAIHDTSSVVGAARVYGVEALKIATTVKLMRALWIIPLSIGTAIAFKSKDSKIKWPYFIFYFLVAMILNTYLPQYLPADAAKGFVNVTHGILIASSKGLTLTLFLIGAGLSKEALKLVGVKPMLLGVILWLMISISSILVIMYTK